MSAAGTRRRCHVHAHRLARYGLSSPSAVGNVVGNAAVAAPAYARGQNELVEGTCTMLYDVEPRPGADGTPLTIVLPLLPGQSEPWRRFLQELQASRRTACDIACQRWGIRSLALWLTAGHAGDLVVAHMVLATDLAGVEERFARSEEPFDRWFAEQARTLHGVDLRRGVGRYRAELLAEWPEDASLVVPGLPMTPAG